jgi:hypothetical protein
MTAEPVKCVTHHPTQGESGPDACRHITTLIVQFFDD